MRGLFKIFLRTCKANVTIFTLKGHCYVIHLCAALTCIFSKHRGFFFLTWVTVCTQMSTALPPLFTPLRTAASLPLGFLETPTCQGGQHKQSDHIVSDGFALPAESKYLVSQLCQFSQILLHFKNTQSEFKNKIQKMHWHISLLSRLSCYFKQHYSFSVTDSNIRLCVPHLQSNVMQAKLVEFERCADGNIFPLFSTSGLSKVAQVSQKI